jgi:hypothetical protein
VCGDSQSSRLTLDSNEKISARRDRVMRAGRPLKSCIWFAEPGLKTSQQKGMYATRILFRAREKERVPLMNVVTKTRKKLKVPPWADVNQSHGLRRRTIWHHPDSRLSELL